tara:strand:- start:1259 stop:1480 length:222 start_codon:yes stop_codon:yes gene_type:complete
VTWVSVFDDLIVSVSKRSVCEKGGLGKTIVVGYDMCKYGMCEMSFVVKKNGLNITDRLPFVINGSERFVVIAP